MSPSKPPWWRAFDRVERAVGKPLEDLVADSRYVDVMIKGVRVQRAVGGAVAKVAGGAAQRVLHAAQMPTRSDVRRLNKQITSLAAEVRALSAQQAIAERQGERQVDDG